MPIIEPEVLMDGTHSIERSAAVTQRVLAAVVKALHDFNFFWEGSLFKPNMCLAGTSSGAKASPEEVARHTVTVLSRTIPAAVPGIMVAFLIPDLGSAFPTHAFSSCREVKARKRRA